jgi:hypothetical protein
MTTATITAANCSSFNGQWIKAGLLTGRLVSAKQVRSLATGFGIAMHDTHILIEVVGLSGAIRSAYFNGSSVSVNLLTEEQIAAVVRSYEDAKL